MGGMAEFEDLMDGIRQQYTEAQTKASLAEANANLSPIDSLGPLIRATRKSQRLTLHDLCDLSGVAYATLSKLESGSASARMDSVQKVLKALGLSLWVG